MKATGFLFPVSSFSFFVFHLLVSIFPFSLRFPHYVLR